MKKIQKFAFGFMLAISFAGITACGDENEDPAIEPIPSESISYTGTTMTYPVSDPDNFYESDRATYAIVYDESSKTATLEITDADFLQGMPQLGVMSFTEINWSYDQKSKLIRLNKEELTPEIGGRPFPMFPITEFVAQEKPGQELGINFVCEYRGVPMHVTFYGTPKQ